ncbi:hypothetical protein [Armatimonas sp.]|uniref:hypothetical protein n=1 Tax=Armatimonas sp. TaxID=1872638 RepID=UPI00286C330C|nr:hypothetical protein [Armatimonas sp.]
MVQKSISNYAALRDRLKPALLPVTDISRALTGLSADAAALLLCQCLQEEQVSRLRRERVTLIVTSIALGLWVLLNYQSGCLDSIPLGIFLAGSLMIALSLWLSVRRYGPLRHNALAGLTAVVNEIHERESLESLCRAAALLDGKKRRWEQEIEEAIRSAIARLLPRLSADDAALLPDDVRQFLLAAITDNRHDDLTVAALLTLGSAKEEAVRPLAENLRTSLTERTREAALECLTDLRR